MLEFYLENEDKLRQLRQCPVGNYLDDFAQRLQYLGSILLEAEGHIQYYGVSFNFRAIQNFQEKATRILFKWLNRRSQRRSFNWEQFALYITANPLPKVTICHALF